MRDRTSSFIEFFLLYGLISLFDLRCKNRHSPPKKTLRSLRNFRTVSNLRVIGSCEPIAFALNVFEEEKTRDQTFVSTRGNSSSSRSERWGSFFFSSLSLLISLSSPPLSSTPPSTDSTQLRPSLLSFPLYPLPFLFTSACFFSPPS